MTKLFAKLRKNEAGATAIEYGLIAALVAVAGIAAMSTIGDSVKANFDSVNTKLDNNKPDA